MAGTQEKIQLLLRIAHRLNEAGVEWALGASMLLYFKGITSDFHDIDLMVADRDAECVRTILSEMGESCPSDLTPNPMYRTKTFATVYKGNIIKNLIMDCQSYTKYRPNETMGGIFVSWRRKEELPTGA